MKARKQPKKQDDDNRLGRQPEAGDDLDERQRQSGMGDQQRAKADSGSDNRNDGGRASNDAGQNRMNEA